MSRQEMLTRLGQLARDRRSDLGLSLVAFAKEAGIGSDRTVRNFEFGSAVPDPITQRKLEDALGWKRGSIRDLLKAADEDAMDAAGVNLEYLTGWVPASRASELEDAELLAETIKRLSRWEAMLREDPPANIRDLRPRKLTPAQEAWEQFGLAADAVPGIKERRTKPAPQATDE